METNKNDMNTLIIEIENLHTGELKIQKMHILCSDIEEEKSLWSNRLKCMHLKTDYKLSRIYINN